MKNTFKRVVSAIAALAITVTCMTSATMPTFFASAEGEVTNVAEYGTVVSNTTKVYNNETDKHKLSNLNDGVTTTSWQAHSDDKKEGLWVGINFDMPIQATQIKLLSNGFAASANNSDKILDGSYVISYNNGSEEITVDSTLISTVDNYLVTTFASATEIYSIKYTFNKFDKSAPFLYEIEVYGTISQINEYKTLINEVLAEYATLNEVDYTEDSWQALVNAVPAAQAALESTDEATVIAAYEALYNAKNNLVEDESLPLREQLASDLATAKVTAQKVAIYTEDTANALRIAIATAEGLLESKDVTALTNAITALTEANAGVEYITEENGFVGNIAVNYYVTPYDNGGAQYGDAYKLSALVDGSTDINNSKWQYKTWQNPTYVGLKFAVPVKAASVRLLANGISADQSGDYLCTTGLTVEYYDAEGNAVSIPSTDWQINGKWLVFSFDELTEITNVRYTITKAGNYAPRLGEIEVYGVVTELDIAKLELAEYADTVTAEIAGLNSDHYTADSWAAVEAAIEAANTALTGDDITAVNTAKSGLETAYAGLALRGSELLAEAVANAEAVIRYRYTADSIALLDAELAKVEATTEEADKLALATAINEAIANLVGDNLALNKDQVTASPNVGYGNEIPRLNDGNMGSRWQSDLNANDVDDFAGINFGSAVTFDTIEVYYEVCRPNKETVQYSQDGVTWNDVPNVTVSGSLDTTVEGTTDRYFRKFSFSAIKAQYVRVYMEGAKGYYYANMSIWEFEVYNTTKAELDAPTTVHYELAVLGAQQRDSVTVDGAKDLRFVAVVDVDVWAANADKITDIGVLLARADQLESAGVDATDLTLDFNNADVIVKKLSAVYFNNSNDQGYYEYYATITGITDEYSDRQYTAVAYYVIDGVAYYATPVTRCVNDYVA